MFATLITLTEHTGVDTFSEALLKTVLQGGSCDGWYQGDRSIDESLVITAVDENSCIDVSLSDVLIFRAQPGSLSSLESTTTITETVMDECKGMTDVITEY